MGRCGLQHTCVRIRSLLEPLRQTPECACVLARRTWRERIRAALCAARNPSPTAAAGVPVHDAGLSACGRAAAHLRGFSRSLAGHPDIWRLKLAITRSLRCV